MDQRGMGTEPLVNSVRKARNALQELRMRLHPCRATGLANGPIRRSDDEPAPCPTTRSLRGRPGVNRSGVRNKKACSNKTGFDLSTGDCRLRLRRHWSAFCGVL
jgi:hypothetical protein